MGKGFMGGIQPKASARKSSSLEPPRIPVYVLGVSSHCRVPSSFPLFPQAHSSPLSLILPLFDLFGCLAENPGRVEVCSSPACW